MPDGFQVDPTALSGVASDLDDAGRTLYVHSADLEVSPDAGSSTGELARTTADLSSALAALAEHIGAMSDTLRDTVAAYQHTDSVASDRLGRLGGSR